MDPKPSDTRDSWVYVVTMILLWAEGKCYIQREEGSPFLNSGHGLLEAIFFNTQDRETEGLTQLPTFDSSNSTLRSLAFVHIWALVLLGRVIAYL